MRFGTDLMISFANDIPRAIRAATGHVRLAHQQIARQATARNRRGCKATRKRPIS